MITQEWREAAQFREGVVPQTAAWPVAWSSVWVGALTAVAVALLIGLIGFALGAHEAAQVADWRKVRFLSLIFNIAGAFLAFVAGGWVAARMSGFRHAEPAILHGAIAWLVTVPFLLVIGMLGGTARFGAWYGALAWAPAWVASISTDPQIALIVRNASLATLAALLLGLVGAVLGGWMASGEPMTFTYYRRRDRAGRPV
jgi:hypothetical protein